jgi:hypothetical protein
MTTDHLGHKIVPVMPSLGITLDMECADLGHPDIPGLLPGLLGRCAMDGPLFCDTCSSPLYLQQRGNRICAIMLNPGEADRTGGPGDLHKAHQERIIRVANAEGFEAELEVRSPSGRCRTDVIVRGAVATIAHEIQVTRIKPATFDKRSKTAESEGLQPSWIVPNLDSPAIQAWPFARMRAYEAREVRVAADLPIEQGVWDVPLMRCRQRAQPCPDTRSTARCSGWHPIALEPRRGETHDSLIRKSAAGHLVARRVKIARGAKGYYRWIPSEDAARLAEVDAERVGRQLQEDLSADTHIAAPVVGFHDGRPSSAAELQPEPSYDESRCATGYEPLPLPIPRDSRPQLAPQLTTPCNAHRTWPNDPWKCEVPGCPRSENTRPPE